MASSSELTLDCKLHHSYSMLLKSFGDHQTDQTQTYKLEEFVARLEEERLKIDAFKRELPLCMQLLTNAMEASRQQLQAYRGNQESRPAVLEEFIPLKYSTSESSEKASSSSDKANWMTSAQLWSQTSEETKPQPRIASPKEAEIGFNVGPKLALDTKQRNGVGAFLPFRKERSSGLPELALASTEKEMKDKKCPEPENPKRESSGRGGGNGGVGTDHGKGTTVSSEQKTTSNTTSTAAITAQTHRKARRCWSPDLHRRFVNVLQMLGGSQVATPKQIRELMKVEGLTNDEVKSHLQKYRLHTRRPIPSQQAAGAPTPQLVVLGGIWVPPEYATAAAAAAAHTGTANALFSPHPTFHAPPPHYCTATPVPPEFYTAAPPQPHSHAPRHHRLHMYRTTSHSQRSPESEARGAGQRSESIEDGKSESSCCKQGDSGENEGGRKGLAALRENGEESNGSEITLKF